MQIKEILNNDQSSNRVVHIRASYQQRSPCPTYCRCDCHKTHTFRSPTIVDHIIGDLFVGYSGYPNRKTSQQCTEENCFSRFTFRVYVRYIFPSWFLAKAIVLGLMTQSLSEVSISLKVQRIIPTGSELFRLAMLNDRDGIKALFSKGLASPNDLDHNGANALYVRHSYS